jgi:hypothetical protein
MSTRDKQCDPKGLATFLNHYMMRTFFSSGFTLWTRSVITFIIVPDEIDLTFCLAGISSYANWSRKTSNLAASQPNLSVFHIWRFTFRTEKDGKIRWDGMVVWHLAHGSIVPI